MGLRHLPPGPVGSAPAQVADRANVSKDEAADVISRLLPTLVDRVSPDGQLPSQDGLSSLLGSLSKQLGG